MPTYFATGVTGTLKICELKAGVSNIIDLQGKQPEQRADATRMQEVMDGATPLSERVIGGVGAADNIVQFLGAQGDMPMKMVVASMHGDQIEGSDAVDVDGTIIAGISKAGADVVPSSSVDSPLTSLDATPTCSPVPFSFNTSPLKTIQDTQLPIIQISSPPPVLHRTQELPQLNFTTGPQCLILNIDLNSKSFIPVEFAGIKKKRMFDYKDLKVEVFINGDLAEVDYITERRIAGKVKSVVLQYKGTRLHRQIEKPWAYMPPQVNTGAVQDAIVRWSNVSESLKFESGICGTDKYGDVPPSGEYLMALSQIALPASIRDCKGLGIVDVVITAGKGQKYGSEIEFNIAPTRMEDDAYTSIDPMLDPEILFVPTSTLSFPSSDSLFMPEIGSSPEIPLAQVRTRAAKYVLTTPSSKSQRTEEELKDSLGLDVNLKKTRIDSFENAHGKGNGKGRSLAERLGDVKKMSPQKQETELAKLREEFGMQVTIDEPAKKKVKLNVPHLGHASAIDQPLNNLPSLGPEGTMSPMDMFKPSTSNHLLTQTPSEATNIDDLGQSRVTLAQEFSVDPNGHLMGQIASFNPAINGQQQVSKVLNTPMKRTKASALANSPAHVPVKVPRTYGKKQKLQGAEPAGGEWDDTPIPFTLDQPTMNLHAARKAKGLASQSSKLLADGKPSRGAGRSSKKWLPEERTAAEALAEFEVPASCVGSCVSFAPDIGVAGGGGAAVGGKVQRQIGRSRKGEFREEEVVVGFRFCVL